MKPTKPWRDMTKSERAEECIRIMDKEYGGYPQDHPQRAEIERQIKGYENCQGQKNSGNHRQGAMQPS
jgi:hypothetical protein